jgi:hypothetical protein
MTSRVTEILRKKLKKQTRDEQGGYIPSSLVRAKNVDLLTLPDSVSGTNCSNCMHVDGSPEHGYCRHPKVRMPVNEHMCCALWDNRQAIRHFSK